MGPLANPRLFMVSVKDQSGDWKIVTALEVRIANPVEMYSDTAGIVAIRKAGATDTP